MITITCCFQDLRVFKGEFQHLREETERPTVR